MTADKSDREFETEADKEAALRAEDEQQVAAENNMPRRVCIDKFTPAERAIWKATHAVEAMGADVRLTDAVTLLGEARDKVADFVDGVEPAADETEHRTPQKIEEDELRVAMHDPELQHRNLLGLASNAAAPAPMRSSQNIREIALGHACRTYGDRNPSHIVIEAAAKFETYLLAGGGVPAKVDKG